MSSPLRIALVSEGPTDLIVIDSVLRAVVGEGNYVLTPLQPEGSEAFGTLGTGWVGIYRWCKQAAARGQGHLSQDHLLFGNVHDILVIQIDADVADSDYAAGNVVPDASDGQLPCDLPCPPAGGSVNALRAVLLSWCGEVAVPHKTVMCVPSKATEAWVVAALFPEDAMVVAQIPPFECFPSPGNRLAQQAVRRRIKKTVSAYRNAMVQIQHEWPRLVEQMTEARRFDTELREILAAETSSQAAAAPRNLD